MITAPSRVIVGLATAVPFSVSAIDESWIVVDPASITAPTAVFRAANAPPGMARTNDEGTGGIVCGIPAALGPPNASICPGVLFPYARSMVSQLVSQGGFPQLLLPPVNFDALFLNAQASGTGAFTETIFYTKSVRLFAFDFGRSESGRDITTDVSTRMWPSLAVALPTFAIGIWVNLGLLVLLATRRDWMAPSGGLGRTALAVAIASLLLAAFAWYAPAPLEKWTTLLPAWRSETQLAVLGATGATIYGAISN